mgnify:CR=1 FL=1
MNYNDKAYMYKNAAAYSYNILTLPISTYNLGLNSYCMLLCEAVQRSYRELQNGDTLLNTPNYHLRFGAAISLLLPHVRPNYSSQAAIETRSANHPRVTESFLWLGSQNQASVYFCIQITALLFLVYCN